MKKVMFWQINDTIVNQYDPSQTFIVFSIQPRSGGNWIILKSIYKNEYIQGYELGMQGMGYVGYREDNTPIFA